VLATVRRSNVVCGFPAPRFHEGGRFCAAMEGISFTSCTNPYSPYSLRFGSCFQPQFRAILEEAVERDMVVKNQARKLAMPPTRKPCGRFLTLEEFDALVAQLEFRDRLIVRMFCAMGFRPGEIFALRWDDIEDGRVCVDESVSRWGVKEPKTEDRTLPPDAGGRPVGDGFVASHAPRYVSGVLVFPTGKGTALSPHNYERDVIVPASIRAGIMTVPPKELRKGDPKRDKATAVNFQSFRRTFATWMQRTAPPSRICKAPCGT
jgi:integrase